MDDPGPSKPCACSVNNCSGNHLEHVCNPSGSPSNQSTSATVNLYSATPRANQMADNANAVPVNSNLINCDRDIVRVSLLNYVLNIT